MTTWRGSHPKTVAQPPLFLRHATWWPLDSFLRNRSFSFRTGVIFLSWTTPMKELICFRLKLDYVFVVILDCFELSLFQYLLVHMLTKYYWNLKFHYSHHPKQTALFDHKTAKRHLQAFARQVWCDAELSFKDKLEKTSNLIHQTSNPKLVLV